MHLALMQAGFEKLEKKLQSKLDAASASPSAPAAFQNDKAPPTVSVRATDLLGMVQTLSAVLNLASFKRAANQASAAAANIDTLRVLGEGAGRARRRSGAASTLSAIDADIANYVLDEFASAKQLNAADVAAADEAGSVASASRARGMGSMGSGDELAHTVSGHLRAGSGGVEIGDDPPPTTRLQEEVAIAAAAVAAAEASRASGTTSTVSQQTQSRFRKGISAVDRLLHATGKIAADAVDRQEAFAGQYLSMAAPTLSAPRADGVLALLEDVGDWDLDVLELERQVSFPDGVESARAATEALVASSGAGPMQPSEKVGPAGSGGHDGLAGVRRMALPFLGMVLLRRHGFLLADGESPQEAAAAARTGPAAVSLKTDEGAQAGGAGARAAASEALLMAERQVLPFLQRLADGYRSNPYHSATHAIDVMYTAHCVVLSPHLHGVIRAEHKLAMLLGAALHDFRHDGTTNALHAKLHSDLALRYNDQSVLESMHVSEAFALMRGGEGELDVLAGMGRDQQRRVREAVVDTVLATDMRFHFRALEDFEVNVLPIVRNYHEQVVSVMSQAQSVKRKQESRHAGLGSATASMTPTPARARTQWASMPSDMSADDDGRAADSRAADSPRDSNAGMLAATVGASLAARYRFGGGLSAVRRGGKKRKARLSVVSAPVAELQEHSMVIAKLAMHAADVSNPVKPLPIYRKWAARCMCEFYHVGDAEREAKLPISTFFDRESRNMPKCQIGFITFVVRPLFAALSELVSDLADEWKTTLDGNQRYFEAKLADGKIDDDCCEGDWFDFDPASVRDGARPADPFNLP